MSSMKVECTGCGEDCSNACATYRGDPYHIGCLPVKRKPAALAPNTTAAPRATEAMRCPTCGQPLVPSAEDIAEKLDVSMESAAMLHEYLVKNMRAKLAEPDLADSSLARTLAAAEGRG